MTPFATSNQFGPMRALLWLLRGTFLAVNSMSYGRDAYGSAAVGQLNFTVRLTPRNARCSWLSRIGSHGPGDEESILVGKTLNAGVRYGNLWSGKPLGVFGARMPVWGPGRLPMSRQTHALSAHPSWSATGCTGIAKRMDAAMIAATAP